MAKVLKNVVVVPVRSLELVNGIQQQKAKKKVAAYCRVSTDSVEQKESYENQVSHYTQHISNNPNWDLVDIYADEGLSGTNTKDRVQFNRMIKDARDGKIDLILTKSISRFSRNTIDLLEFVRELKEKRIAVLFEKENINTLESSGEVFLTIFSSIAQDESRNISENSKWGIQKGFANGKVHCNTTRFLGYDKDPEGELIINEEQAKLVRRIYKEYMDGKSYNAIAKGLMKDGIQTVTGNEKWWDSTITLILTNEKYYGALLQQKTITVDFLAHKRVKNNGQEQKYMIEDNHEPIITKEMFDAVQREKERRALLKGNIKGDRQKYTSKYPFSGKVICKDCENVFKRRTWNSNNPSKKVVWQCKTYVVDGKEACNAKSVDEKVLMDAFVRMFNKLHENKQMVTKKLLENIEKVIMKKTQSKQIEVLDNRTVELKEELKGLIRFQVKKGIDDEVYNEEYKRLMQELDKLRNQRLEHEKENTKKDDQRERVNEIVDTLKNRQELLEEFDEKIFNALVEKIDILSPTHFIFVLKSGMKIDHYQK